MQVQLAANHMGYFEFSLCPLKSPNDIATDECFNAHPIYLQNGERRYKVAGGVTGLFNIVGVLPKGVTCKHCELRWHYSAGNNWGVCPDGTGRLGCGPQEFFRSCSDISIQ